MTRDRNDASGIAVRRLVPATLGGRLIAVLALFITLVTSGVVGVQFVLGRAELARDAGLRLDGEAAAVAQRLMRDVRARVQSAAVWSELEAAQDIVTDDIDKRLAMTLERLVAGLGAQDVGLALDDSGRVIAASRRALAGQAASIIPPAARSCGTSDTAAAVLGAIPGARTPMLLVRHAIRARADGRRIGCLLLATPWRALIGGVVAPQDLDRVTVRRDGLTVWPGSLGASGVPVITGAASVSDQGMRLAVEVAQSRADALLPVRQRGLVALLLAIAVMAVALPAAFITARSTAKPLRALTASAQALRDGDRAGLTAPDVDAPREVRVLHEALDSMLRRLEQSRRAMLEREALASLGTMAAALAHEIRTPLAVVQSSAQLLDDDQAPDRRHELSSLVLAEVARLDRLVTDLLAFARPRAPELGLGDLATVARRAAHLLAPLCERHRVTLDLDLSPAPALMDDDQMQQVVLNLASNAVQFSPSGGVVRIAARAADGAAALTVTDSGEGIDAARLAEVFKPFHSTRRGGTGLGLAIVKQIIDRHGGTIEATSAPGSGTTVRVVLPSPAG